MLARIDGCNQRTLVDRLQNKEHSTNDIPTIFFPTKSPTAHSTLESPIQLMGLIHLFQFFEIISLTIPQGTNWVKMSSLFTVPKTSSKCCYPRS